MRSRFGRIIVLITMLFFVGACAKGNAVEVGGTAPDFSLADIEGNVVNFSQFTGKVIILNFFASWCPPCRQEVPEFIELQNAYGSSGFTMVGISLVSAGESKSFSQNMGINYPVLVDDGTVSDLYGPVRSIPTTFVIGRDGRVAKHYIGYRSKEVFERDIKELLK